jgi:hypothetical protein
MQIPPSLSSIEHTKADPMPRQRLGLTTYCAIQSGLDGWLVLSGCEAARNIRFPKERKFCLDNIMTIHGRHGCNQPVLRDKAEQS